jgi:hypothetical protein
VNWRNPASCTDISGCIEVIALIVPVGSVGIRTDRRRYLTATRAEFAAFIAAAKLGEYDDLCEPTP